jgi:hypothetical protein
VTQGGRIYVVIVTPSYLSAAARQKYASLFMDGFQYGLRGRLPLVHFHPPIKPEIEQGWIDGNNQGLREYARYHWDDIREQYPGLYDQLVSEGFKPVRK